MKGFFKKLEMIMMAVSFAEANQSDSAKHYLKEVFLKKKTNLTKQERMQKERQKQDQLRL